MRPPGHFSGAAPDKAIPPHCLKGQKYFASPVFRACDMIYCEKGQKPRKEGKAMLKDVSSSAAALYDGGWRSADADQLRTEYDLTEEETQELCTALADLEEKNK